MIQGLHKKSILQSKRQEADVEREREREREGEREGRAIKRLNILVAKIKS